MPESKSITISGKNLMTWVAIATIAIGSIVDSALTRDKVTRHDALLNQYNIPVMNEQMKNIAGDVSELKIMLVEFIKEYNSNHD